MERKPGESISKWYYRHQKPLTKLKMRWNWIKSDIRGFICIICDKIKYGWKYNENDAINEKGD